MVVSVPWGWCVYRVLLWMFNYLSISRRSSGKQNKQTVETNVVLRENCATT